jgi:hypothetical protein
MVVNMWRVGAAAVAPDNAGEDAWARPIGARGELEKEKKTLLKAIKEAEFDLEMGKLSKADADEMIKTYRGRAIEVIKELERFEGGEAEGPREQIKREVQARSRSTSRRRARRRRPSATTDERVETARRQAARREKRAEAS